MDLAEELGTVALDTFMMPMVKGAVTSVVQKDPYRSPAEKDALIAELTQAIRDAGQVGLEAWMASKKPQTMPIRFSPTGTR